jgi:hypothetical protein
MALPGRDDATAAAWQRGIDNLRCPPRPRRGTDLSMEVEPPLDEHDPEPFTTAWRRSSPHAHRSMKVDEQDYDAWNNWVPGGAE